MKPTGTLSRVLLPRPGWSVAGARSWARKFTAPGTRRARRPATRMARRARIGSFATKQLQWVRLGLTRVLTCATR